MSNNEFNKVRIKNRTCYYFDDIAKFEDFGFDLISLKSSITYVFFFTITRKSKLSLMILYL